MLVIFGFLNIIKSITSYLNILKKKQCKKKQLFIVVPAPFMLTAFIFLFRDSFPHKINDLLKLCLDICPVSQIVIGITVF